MRGCKLRGGSEYAIRVISYARGGARVARDAPGQVQSLVAKRVRTCVRRRRVSHIRSSGEHRAFGAPMNENCTLWTLRVERLKRFLCFVSLSLRTKK